MLNPNLRDSSGNTLLHIAVQRNLLPVVEWLCEERKASVHVANYYRKTPIQIAEELGYTDIQTYLLGYPPVKCRVKSNTI